MKVLETVKTEKRAKEILESYGSVNFDYTTKECGCGETSALCGYCADFHFIGFVVICNHCGDDYGVADPFFSKS